MLVCRVSCAFVPMNSIYVPFNGHFHPIICTTVSAAYIYKHIFSSESSKCSRITENVVHYLIRQLQESPWSCREVPTLCAHISLTMCQTSKQLTRLSQKLSSYGKHPTRKKSISLPKRAHSSFSLVCILYIPLK